MECYKNPEWKNRIRKRVTADYRLCPVETERITVESDEFGATHVLAAGASGADPLVLLHGTSGNSTAWFGVIPHLADTRRIYMVDLPGQPGLSGSDRPSVADGSMVRWLEEVFDSLELETVGIAGLSFGGWLALHFSAKNSGRVSRLALLSPSGICPPRPGFFLRILPLAFLGRLGRQRIFSLIHGPVPVHPDMLTFSNLVSKGYRPLTEPLPLLEDRELQSISCPILMVGGEKDVMLDMPGSASRLAGLGTGATTIVRKGFSHVLPDEGATLAGFFVS